MVHPSESLRNRRAREHRESAHELAELALETRGRRRRSLIEEATLHALLAGLEERISHNGVTNMDANENVEPQSVTLYERLTHLAPVDNLFATITSDFYTQIIGPVGRPDLGDPLLAPYFSRVDRDRLERHMTSFLLHATGGPRTYRGASMAKAHGHLSITDSAFSRVVAHLVAVLRHHRVPEAMIAEIGALVEPLRPTIVTSTADHR